MIGPRITSLAALLLLFGLAFSLFGCEQKAPPQPLPTTQLLGEPLEATVTELPFEAAPVWRQYRTASPALLLLSDNPLLAPLPVAIREQVKELLSAGTPDDLRRAGPFVAETLILPDQSLSAALDLQLFSALHWVVPSDAAQGTDLLAQIPEALFQSGAINDYERAAFQQDDSGLRGRVGETPLFIHPADQLPSLETTVIVHIDLSFFSAAYRNEIQTPIFSQLAATLKALRAKGYRVHAVTISQSNFSEQVPLDFRYLAPLLTRILDEPSILEESLPHPWKLKKDALYLDTFFQPEKRYEIYSQLAELDPGNPDAYYGRYLAELGLKRLVDALNDLDRAAAIDPVYALEFLLLASRAEAAGNSNEARHYLDQALQHLPDNPYLQLRRAELLLRQIPSEASALASLEALQQLNWSQQYGSPFRERIDALLKRHKPAQP